MSIRSIRRLYAEADAICSYPTPKAVNPKESERPTKKNCHTCEHLEYETGDEWGIGAGWYCEKRDPTTVEAESKLLKDMQRQEYRDRYKRCFEPRRAPAQGAGGQA